MHYGAEVAPEKFSFDAPPTRMADLSEFPEEFRRAAEWMIERDVMTRDELTRVLDLMEGQFPQLTPSQIESSVRRRVLALSEATNASIVGRVQATITNAIGSGLTRREFAESLQELVASGQLPGGTDAYLENVFRTETASAYAQEREAFYREPAIASHFWGVELYNPDDGSSRRSHAKLDRKFFRRGSAAYAALGIEPFDYQCRCARAPILVEDLDNPGFEESPDALKLALGLERF